MHRIIVGVRRRCWSKDDLATQVLSKCCIFPKKNMNPFEIHLQHLIVSKNTTTSFPFKARNPYEIHPDPIDFEGNLTWTMSQWNALRPCFSTKCWKAQFSVLVKNARGLDGWLGGKRRKQHLSRSLESGSLRLVVLFVLIWRMFFFFARKLRHEARYSSLDLN